MAKMSSEKQIFILLITITWIKKKKIYILKVKNFLKLPNVKRISFLIVNYIFIFYKRKKKEEKENSDMKKI